MMTHTADSFSVIICAYTLDRWNDLLAAIASVQTQSLPALEIIVVIDHNPDLLSWLRRSADSRVAVIPNAQTQGLSGARNKIGRASCRERV